MCATSWYPYDSSLAQQREYDQREDALEELGVVLFHDVSVLPCNTRMQTFIARTS